MKKLRSKAGETLPEVLVALLVVVLTFLFLTGAVTSAARVNSTLKNETVAFQSAAAETSVSASVAGASVNVNVHKTANGYYYYDCD